MKSSIIPKFGDSMDKTLLSDRVSEMGRVIGSVDRKSSQSVRLKVSPYFLAVWPEASDLPSLTLIEEETLTIEMRARMFERLKTCSLSISLRPPTIP